MNWLRRLLRRPTRMSLAERLAPYSPHPDPALRTPRVPWDPAIDQRWPDFTPPEDDDDFMRRLNARLGNRRPQHEPPPPPPAA